MTELIKEIFLQNIFSSIKVSVVIILLFALTKPVTKRFTAGFRYYSWLAVMIIYLIPFAGLGVNYQIDLTPITADIRNEMRDIRNWYEEKTPTYTVTEEYNGYELVETPYSDEAEYIPVVKTASAKKQIDVKAVLALVWLITALGYFSLHFGRYIGFRRGLRRLCRDIDDNRIYGILECEKQRLGISCNIRLKLFPLVDTPLLTGIIRPEIILPHTDYTDEELHLILRHELFHFKRRDILYQLVTLVFVSLHWFNPFVHLMAKAIETDGETSCDEKTLEGRSYDEKIFYGEMLIKFLKTTTQKRSYMTTTFFGGKKGMKKRLTLIASRKARRKGKAAMAFVTAIAVITSIGTAAMGNEYFDSVFEGDTSYLADFIKTEKKSVEDDRFRLTLEQYLVAENQALIVYSFEAKTSDAVEELNSDEFWGMDTIMFGPTDYEKASCGGYGGRGTVGKGLSTESKIYGCIASDRIQNEEKIDFYLSTNKIEGYPKIIIPMDHNMETKTVQCGDITVKYNPISIILLTPASEPEDECDDCYFRRNNIYFKMDNGGIKTFNELYDQSSGRTNFDENGNVISFYSTAWAREIIEPDEITSVIVDDTEYPVDDPSNSKPITIDEHMKPFIIDAYVKDHLWIPLRAFCEGLGAELKWDADTKTASFDYCGSSFAITVGKTSIVVDGEEYDIGNKAPFIDEQGRMIAPFGVNEYNNNTYIAVDVHGYNAYIIDDTTGEAYIDPNAKLHIIP